jgi:excisionase family DNA binding protein
MRSTMPQQVDTVLAVGMSEAARRLGLSPRTVATLVLHRQLASRKVGSRRIIPVSALEAFIRHDHPSACKGPAKVVEGTTYDRE